MVRRYYKDYKDDSARETINDIMRSLDECESEIDNKLAKLFNLIGDDDNIYDGYARLTTSMEKFRKTLNRFKQEYRG